MNKYRRYFYAPFLVFKANRQWSVNSVHDQPVGYGPLWLVVSMLIRNLITAIEMGL